MCAPTIEKQGKLSPSNSPLNPNSNLINKQKGAAMRLTDIQKTPTGYIIRHNKAVKAITLVLCAFLLSLGVLLLLATERDTVTIGLVVLFMIFFDALAIYLFCPDFGFRIVIDETGVHRYSFNRVKHTLLWRYIRSFGVGVIPVPWRYHQIDHLAFYASTEAKPVKETLI